MQGVIDEIIKLFKGLKLFYLGVVKKNYMYLNKMF